MSALQVEVFPIEPTRWIAVIDAPAGAFSTEATAPSLVADEVARTIADVLGAGTAHRLVDEDGREWSADIAEEQLRRLQGETTYPRRLTAPEQAILDALLGLEFVGAAALREQARSVVVTARCECGCPGVDLAVQDVAAPLWADGADVVEGEAKVPVEGRSVLPGDPFDVILWTRGGRLSLMEYVGPPESHATWPSPLAFDFWTY